MKTVKIYSEIADGLADMIAENQNNHFDDDQLEDVNAVYLALIDLIASPSGTSITLEIK